MTHMLVWPCVMSSVLCGDVDPSENVEGNIKDPEHEGHVAHIQTQPQKSCEKQTHMAIKRQTPTVRWTRIASPT